MVRQSGEAKLKDLRHAFDHAFDQALCHRQLSGRSRAFFRLSLQRHGPCGRRLVRPRLGGRHEHRQGAVPAPAGRAPGACRPQHGRRAPRRVEPPRGRGRRRRSRGDRRDRRCRRRQRPPRSPAILLRRRAITPRRRPCTPSRSAACATRNCTTGTASIAASSRSRTAAEAIFRGSRALPRNEGPSPAR